MNCSYSSRHFFSFSYLTLTCFFVAFSSFPDSFIDEDPQKALQVKDLPQLATNKFVRCTVALAGCPFNVKFSGLTLERKLSNTRGVCVSDITNKLAKLANMFASPI